MARLLIERGGRTRVLEIRGEEVVLGRDPGSHVRLEDPTIAGRHLRVVAVEGGFRAEALDEEGGFEVGGERVREWDLADGDRLAVGPYVVRFQEAEAETVPAGASAGSPSAASGGGHRREGAARTRRAAERASPEEKVVRRARRLRHRSGLPTWATLGLFLLGFLVVGLVFYWMLGTSRFERMGPAELHAHARDFFSRGQEQEALERIRMAMGRDPDPQTRRALEELQGQIERTIRLRDDRPILERARVLLEWMDQFERAAVRDLRDPRPGARVLVREARSWLETYAELASQYEVWSGMVGRVREHVARWEEVAQLDSPDTARDAVVHARHHQRNRRYGQAFAVLDRWLTANAGAAGAETVRSTLQEFRAEAEAALDEAMAQARRDLQARDYHGARRVLLDIIERSGIPSRVQAAEALLREVDQRAGVRAAEGR